MSVPEQPLSILLKEIRRQLAMSQEDLARQLGVSFATVNRWENDSAKPSKLAKAQIEAFCSRMTAEGKIKIPKAGLAK